MTLCSQYRLLPFPIHCDTLLLCYNPYFDVQFKQCHSIQELFNSAQQASSPHRIVFMAETIEEGNDLISKVNRLREEVERRDFNCGKKTDLVEDETANDRLTLLAEQLVHRPHQKSSFLRLKCLLNKTEDKINTLTNQIKSRQTQKLDKRTQKQLKIQEKEKNAQQKQLKELCKDRENIRDEISTHEDMQWWKQQCKDQLQAQQQDSLSSCEPLLSDSEEEKENLLWP